MERNENIQIDDATNVNVQLNNKKKSELFFDEHESWIQFNQRVANEASRSRNPILERLNFICIADSNLDEFIRTKFDKSKKHKKLISDQTKQIEEIYDTILDELREKYKINITTPCEIRNDRSAYQRLKDEFKKNIYPMIQPLTLTNELPIPDMADGGSFIITKLDDGDGGTTSCIMKLPEPGLVKIKSFGEYEQTYVLSDAVIEEFIREFYRGKQIICNDKIRVLRKVDSLNADESDYIYGIRKQIKDRKCAEVQMIDTMIDSGSINEYKGLVKGKVKRRKRKYVFGLSHLNLVRSIFKYNDSMIFPKAKPRTPVRFVGETIFDVLTDNDVLLRFPYESFQLSTVRFLEEAAVDPDVVSIKQTLYRVGKDSPLVAALIKAAENGKQVIVLLELKAKMDEKHNLELTETLKNAGCNVIFGPIRMKTHAKVTLIIRKEGNKLAKYANISTGNFNDKTAKLYEDISYFVKERSKQKIGADLCDLFNYLGGFSDISGMNELLISPKTFRPNITSEIDKCIKSKIEHPDAEVTIQMKCNSFTDRKIAMKLYEASNVGVKVNLIIRGACIIRPGVEGQSSNINIISIVGRYLEHSRIYEFTYMDDNGDKVTKSYLGSGDMMPRNLDYRVEVIVPIRTMIPRAQISTLFDEYFEDNTNSYKLLPNGSYINPDDSISEDDRFSVQENLIKDFKELEKAIIR